MIIYSNYTFSFDDLTKVPKIKVVYQIINTKNNRGYIGKTVNFKKRLQSHLSDLKHNKHHSIFLQRDYNKYKGKHFKIQILKQTSDDEDLKNSEIELINSKKYNSIYNSSYISYEDFLKLPIEIQEKINKDKYYKLLKAKLAKRKEALERYEKTKIQAIKLINKGLKVSEICKMLKISANYLLKIRRNNINVINPDYRETRPEFYNIESLNNEIVELLRKKYSTRKIAKILNIGKSTVSYRCIKYDLKNLL